MVLPPMVSPHPARRPIVITGASSGIGAATAIQLAQSGHPVALGARRVEKLEEIATAIRAEGGEAIAAALDLHDAGSVQAFADKVFAEFGSVEAVVSNAGGSGAGRIAQVGTDQIMRELDLNVGGAHRLIRAFVPEMIERNRGDIVFVSSDVAVRARPGLAGYAAAKWGLEGLIASFQQELEGTGVKASVVRPGPTHSEMGLDWDPDLTTDALTLWMKHGHARHGHFLAAERVANALVTVVTAPPDVHLQLVEVSPAAPIEKEQS